ncbi:DUF2877 domain-containing protein [Microbacterium sp. ASV49]|uniref:DUF2877 domain-containing protein n=1 Tax=Microbacterium candidum TaxID=3041922 RepID=A0ABT7N1K3_9MICO|nr:DUF2877 domain-containing protein [Microbacterium sp. ASV49]MDL9980587.1 DUF2877 domain-containing protein [Microbacterium sp. ASV49]
MRTATAISADAELLAAPPSALAGRVHSVFRSVVNIAVSDGSLWCLAASAVAPGPRTVTVDAASFADFGIAPGQPVAVDDAAVRIDEALIVSLRGARVWEPAELPGPVSAARVHELEGALDDLGIAGGARGGDDVFSRAVSDRISTGLAAIAAAVDAQDADAVGRAATRLVGLGTGLTPAGDDVLTGLAYASARLGGRLAIVPDAVAYAASSGSTHEISLTAMREACRGRAVQPLSDLLIALCRGDDAPPGERAPIRELTAALVGLGHTSGTDQATGLLAAVRMTQGMRGK